MNIEPLEASLTAYGAFVCFVVSGVVFLLLCRRISLVLVSVTTMKDCKLFCCGLWMLLHLLVCECVGR